MEMTAKFGLSSLTFSSSSIFSSSEASLASKIGFVIGGNLKTYISIKPAGKESKGTIELYKSTTLFNTNNLAGVQEVFSLLNLFRSVSVPSLVSSRVTVRCESVCATIWLGHSRVLFLSHDGSLPISRFPGPDQVPAVVEEVPRQQEAAGGEDEEADVDLLGMGKKTR